MKTFKSILEFQKHFNTEEKCRAFLEQRRWNGTPACPRCGSVNVTRLKDGRRFQCNEKECRKQFSVTVGTVYENTKIPLTKWFLAIYILSVHSKGIASLQLATWLGVTQKTSWFLNHRIRVMLTEKDPQLLSGICEVDETYIGGLEKNKHLSKRIREGIKPKTLVIGAVQRKGGKVRTKVIPAVSTQTLKEAVQEFIQPDSTMLTDEHRAYAQLRKKYTHHAINHRESQYVREKWIHTNSIEGYWNILKKQISGIHHSVSPKHLQRYCDENAYRYNNRELTQDERFADSLTNCEGRLKYSDLTKKSDMTNHTTIL